ncbi:dihydroorotase [Halocola ammonii]
MKTLIKAATIVEPGSKYHLKKRDLLIDKGRIEKIAAKIDESDHKILSHSNLHVSAGWIDMRANFQDPGFEYKEDLESGMKAAANGGFTGVVLTPFTDPPVSHKAQVEYIINQTQKNVVRIFPTGTLSQDGKGENLSEMYDMHRSGAVAFSDDKRSVNRTEMMSRGLDYARNFDGLVMSFPFDDGVNPGGVMHESAMSVSLGMRGIPSLAEELRLKRDIELLRYHGGKMHVSLISTEKSVDIIRQAKKDGLAITAGVCAHQLYFTDEDLKSFDTRLKVLPPFRSKSDVKALIKGIADGTIDVICSDHTPEDVEAKKREFEHAAYGISSIETTFCTAFTKLEKSIDLEKWILALTKNPRSILGLAPVSIQEGESVDLTFFDPNGETSLSASDLASKSKNSPLLDTMLKGKVLGIARGKFLNWK